MSWSARSDRIDVMWWPSLMTLGYGGEGGDHGPAARGRHPHRDPACHRARSRGGVRKGMAAMSGDTYRVVVTREDGHWLADVPSLEGAHTYARSLPTLDQAVREVVVLAADLPDEAMPSSRAGLRVPHRRCQPRRHRAGGSPATPRGRRTRRCCCHSHRPGRRRAGCQGTVSPRCRRPARHQSPARLPAHGPGKLSCRDCSEPYQDRRAISVQLTIASVAQLAVGMSIDRLRSRLR